MMTPAQRAAFQDLVKVVGLLSRLQRRPCYRAMLDRAVAAAEVALSENPSSEGMEINKPAGDPLAQLRAALQACEAAGLPGGVVAGEVYHGFRLGTLMDQEPTR